MKTGLIVLSVLLNSQLVRLSEVPLYYGWFMEPDGVKAIQETAQSYYKQLWMKSSAMTYMLEYFKIDGDPLALPNYFSRDDLDSSSETKTLHVTAMYCGAGSVPECVPYMKNPGLQDAVDKQYQLEVIGFVITPKTMGARIRLSSGQLAIWGQDDTKGVPGALNRCCDDLDVGDNMTSSSGFQPITGKGSRAHITLSSAKGVKAVQTGYDLVAAVNCEEHCKADLGYFSMTGAKGRYYGLGEYVIYLDKPVVFDSKFKAFMKSTNSGPNLTASKGTVFIFLFLYAIYALL